MKPMGGTAEAIKTGVVTAEEMLRYAMSLPVATTITGMDSPEVLRQNLRIAQDFKPMTPAEMDALREQLRRAGRRRAVRALQGVARLRQPAGPPAARFPARSAAARK